MPTTGLFSAVPPADPAEAGAAEAEDAPVGGAPSNRRSWVVWTAPATAARGRPAEPEKA